MSSRLLATPRAAASLYSARRLGARALGFQVSSPEERAKWLEKPAENPASSYTSPPLINDVFASAYSILSQQSEATYARLDTTKAADAHADALQVQAEKHNPEVLYNFRFNKAKVDPSQPVYRHLMQKEWEGHDLMVTMQRLEQLHVIPDTLPTLEPRAHVQVHFAHNTEAEFSGAVPPGQRMPAFAVNRPPSISVQDFRPPADFGGLYSVLVVNPDVPDLATNSFRTSLNYGLCNVKVSFSDPVISPASLLGTDHVFSAFRPLVPEKNAPTQRACVWVFRQERPLSDLSFDAKNFDIRSFVDSYGLDAVGAHVWRQGYDRSTNAVRRQYGMPRGTVFSRVRGDRPLV